MPISDELKALNDYLKEVFGIEPNSSMPTSISRQINRAIITLDFTPQEIVNCVKYGIEHEKIITNSLYGIWFIENVRGKAKDYFNNLEKKEQERIEDAKKIVSQEQDGLYVNIKEISKRQMPRKLKQLDFGKIDLKEGDPHGE